MELTDHLDRIYQLVLDRADPARIRGHIELIREQVEAVAKIEAKLRKQIARDKKLHAEEMAKLEKEHAAEVNNLCLLYVHRQPPDA
jgi:hypothetical protein